MKLDSKVYSPAQLADAMTALHKKHFDFLVTIVGEDFGEEGLGCVYILENTDTHERISVKSVNPDRQEPWLPTVSHLWKAAELLEREVYDFYGIVFTGHPDMRRLYLRSDFQGFPFRKDYQMPKDKPFTLDDDPEPNCTCTYILIRRRSLSQTDSTTSRP